MKTRKILSTFLAFLMLMSVVLSASVTAEETSPYKDVKPSRWSYADIMYVSERGLMTGTSADKFAPAETMTRAMVVTVLYRLQGEPAVEYQSKFNDIKKDKWYTDAVIWAAEKSIVEGKGNGIFAPMENVTREQLAAIIKRYAPCEFIITDETTDITGYADYNRVHDYAREALAWANAVGLITGKTETTLAPREGATREQFAAILKRFKEYDAYEYRIAYNRPTTYSKYTEKPYELVTDADIYVAVDGNDTNPGTLDKPVKTFAKAKEMVRELKKTATDEIKVAFKAGEYGSLDNLTFTAEDAGTAEVPITYCKYGDGAVTFRNGIYIFEDEFKPLDESDKAMFNEKYQADIYKADLSGRFDQFGIDTVLFSSNSGTCWEARYPNKKADGTDAFYTDFTTRVEEEGKDVHDLDKLLLMGPVAKIANSFSTYKGMKITGFFRCGWLVDTFAVKSYDRATNILTIDFENSSDNGYPGYELAYEDRMDDTIFFHNLAELMDAKGEYWFDENTKQLYVFAPDGDYAIGSGGTFITLEEGADHISFIGFEFNAAADRAMVTKADYTTYKLCSFGNICGKAVIYGEHIHDLTVSECEFFNFTIAGIDIDADANQTLVQSGNNVIENNYFHDFSLPQYFDSTAVDVNNDVATVVAHNHFVNGAHAAVRYYKCMDMVIEYNIFDNMMMNTQDFGAVYTVTNSHLRGNTIRYNLFMNQRVYGIYIDAGASGQEVYGNIFYQMQGTNIVLNGGRDNIIRDNIHIDNLYSEFITSNKGIYSLYENGTSDQIFTSEIYKNSTEDAPQEGEEGYEIWREKWPIIYQYHTDVSRIDEVECIFRTVNYFINNYTFGFVGEFIGGAAESCGVIENNLAFGIDENPLFVDPTHGDYRLREDADFIDIQFDKIGRY